MFTNIVLPTSTGNTSSGTYPASSQSGSSQGNAQTSGTTTSGTQTSGTQASGTQAQAQPTSETHDASQPVATTPAPAVDEEQDYDDGTYSAQPSSTEETVEPEVTDEAPAAESSAEEFAAEDAATPTTVDEEWETENEFHYGDDTETEAVAEDEDWSAEGEPVLEEETYPYAAELPAEDDTVAFETDENGETSETSAEDVYAQDVYAEDGFSNEAVEDDFSGEATDTASSEEAWETDGEAFPVDDTETSGEVSEDFETNAETVEMGEGEDALADFEPTPANTSPVASTSGTRTSSADHATSSTSFRTDALEARTSRRIRAEEEAETEVARNRAEEVQRSRIIQGLLDSIVNSDKTAEISLLSKEPAAEEKPSLVEKYYAEA